MTVISNLSTAPYSPPVTQPTQVAQGGASVNFTSSYNAGSASSTLSYPIDQPKYCLSFNISNFVRPTISGPGTFQQSSYPNIILPLPMQMVDTNHVNWAAVDLGTFVPNLNDAGQVGQIIGVTHGVAPNQFMTMLMKGPQFKQFRFVWELSPDNFQEADQLRQIINVFKNAMAPNPNGINPGGVFGLVNNIAQNIAGQTLVWGYPNVFYMAVYPNSKFMFKFKPCIMDFFAVNYMPGGRGAFHVNNQNSDGANAPESLQIQMNLIELEFWITGNYDNSNDPTAVEGISGLSGYNGPQNASADETIFQSEFSSFVADQQPLNNVQQD